jgi:gas vesicle protein
MTARVKSFIVGLVIGALLAFVLGMNYGRGDPLLSNPFRQRDLGATLKNKAEHLADEAREKIHEATKPEAPKK